MPVTGGRVRVLDLDRSAYRETLALSKEDGLGLADLLKEAERLTENKRKKRKG